MQRKVLVSQNVQNIALVSRIFYFSIHTFALSLLLYFKSPLQEALYNGDWFKILIFILKIIIASYFYMICGNNPGSHYPSPLERGEHGIELETSNSQLPQFQTIKIEKEIKQSPQLDTPRKILKNDIQVISVSQQNERKSLQSSVSQNSLDVNSDDCPVPDIPEKRYCDKCQFMQPFRTKHCDQCERCIPRYDHHCFWIGGCVGELNHRLFWIFLFFQTIVNYTGFDLFLISLDNYNHVNKETGTETFDSPYFILLFADFVCFGFTVFTGALFFYHTALISQGQTTWEQTKRSQISYLRKYPDFYNPFHQGIKKNIQLTLCHNNQLRHWIVPTYQQAQQQSKSQFNYFDNKYYSCC